MELQSSNTAFRNHPRALESCPHCFHFHAMSLSITAYTARKSDTFYAAKRYLNNLAVVLLGCVASRPATGWRLTPSNSTRIADGSGVGHGHRDT